MSTAIQKRSRGVSVKRPSRSSAAAYATEWTRQSSPPPNASRRRREDTVEIAVGADVALAHEVAAHGLGQLPDALLDSLTLVGERELGALVVEALRDRPGDRALVRDAEHERLLAVEPPGHGAILGDVRCTNVAAHERGGRPPRASRARSGRDGRVVGDRRGNRPAARRRVAGVACSSPGERTGSAPSPSEIGGEVEVCDVADREAVEATAARVLAAASSSPAARQQRRHPCARLVSHARSRADRARDARQLPGRRVVHPLVPAAASRRRSQRRAGGRGQHRLGRRDGRVRSCRAVRGGEARAAGVLAFAAVRRYGTAESAATPCCPASSRPRASRSTRCSRAATLRRFLTDTDAVARCDHERRGAQSGRGDRAVVPLQVRRVWRRLSFPTLTSRLAGRFTYHRGEQHV